jgi:hypothetical protein
VRVPGRESLKPYRELVHACSRGGTYKYFLSRDEVRTVWERLAAQYGSVRTNDAMKTMEIESERFILRSTLLANPITVIRKRRCTADDVARLHADLGYEEDDAGR